MNSYVDNEVPSRHLEDIEDMFSEFKDVDDTTLFQEYNKLQSTKTSIGKAGEYLILDLLHEQYDDQDVRIDHVAETQGDGCGYDIKVVFSNKFNFS